MASGYSVLKHIQNGFLAGELSGNMLGRSDFQNYNQGVLLLENFMLLQQGGAKARWGTHFTAECKFDDLDTRLLPFEYSTVQAYQIETGDRYMRFYRSNGRIESPPGTPVEIVTTYDEADIKDIHFAQTADSLYLVHKFYPPRKVTRTSDTAWSITNVNWIDGPYLATNTTAVTLDPTAVSGTITIIASAPTFNAGHVGALWRLQHAGTWGYVRITVFNSTTDVTAEVLGTLAAATATSIWAEGAWSTFRGFPCTISTFEGRLMLAGTAFQPQTVWGSVSDQPENMTPGVNPGDALSFTINDARLNLIRWLQSERVMVAGTIGNEFAIYGSNDSGMTPTNIQVKSQTAHGSNVVQPVKVGHAILFAQRAGTKLYELGYNFFDAPFIAPDLTLFASHITGTGLKYISYQQEPHGILWGTRLDGEIATLTYLKLQEVVAWSRQVTKGIFECVSVTPDAVRGEDQPWAIVGRTIDGVAKQYVEYFDPTINVDSGLVFDGTNNVSTLTPGAGTGLGVTFLSSPGAFAAGDVGKYLHSITGTGRAKIVSFVNGSQVTADIITEFKLPSGSFGEIAASGWGIGVDSVSGLGHLEGEVVEVVADNAEQPPQIVTGGIVNLTTSSGLVISVGLGYVCSLKTLAPEANVRDGTIQGRQTRYSKFQVRLLDTQGLRVNGREILFRSAGDPMGQAIPPFTGIKTVSLTGYEPDNPVLLEQVHPLPCTILSLMGTLEVGDP